MGKKFRVIVADPPWAFKDPLTMSDTARGAESNYHLMSFKDIRELPIKDLIHPEGSILALWVPSSMLVDGLETMYAWGFKPKQTYVWVKTKFEPLETFKKLMLASSKIMEELEPSNKVSQVLQTVRYAYQMSAREFNFRDMLAFGMGRLFRQTHEIALIGTSDNSIYKSLSNKSQRSVSLAPNLKHSAKPEDLQDSLDLMFPRSKKIELFARRQRPGWVCLGDEICNGEDIRVSLAKL